MHSGTLSRRIFLAGAALALPAAASPPTPSSQPLLFKVMRKGSQIGTHGLTFAPNGDDLTVHIAVDIAVGIGPLKFYRYTLRATEYWRGGVLQAGNSDTDNNGGKAWLRAERQGDRLHVAGSKGPSYMAPAGTIIASHWNRDELRAPMVDLEDGGLMNFTVTPGGPERITVRGRQIQASHFALRGPAAVDLWYDEANVWSRLTSVVEDGSTIEYVAA